jgi:flagella basal body P-ring formation protein FlgA
LREGVGEGLSPKFNKHYKKGKLMKNLAKMLISVVMLLSFSTGAGAVALTSQVITDKTRNDITASLKQLTNGRIEVTTSPLPYPSIDVPQGKVEIKTEFSPANLRSSSLVRVGIYVNSINVRNFGVKADIKVYDKVWVANDWINKGSALGSLKYEEKEVSQILEKLPEKGFSPSSYIARKSIAPGEIIALDNIEGLPSVIQNSPVSVIFSTPEISVTVPATALMNGKTGDFIRVRSDTYKKIYVGKVIGENIVLVNI